MDWFTAISVAGVAASIAGAILTWQARDTKRLIERMDARHAAQMAARQGMLDRMDKAADQRQQLIVAKLEGR